MAENYTDMLERLYNNLPRIYRDMDMNQRYQLKRYLEILTSKGFSPVYEETKALLDLNDFDRIPKQYLPQLASVLGFKFPYDLDEQTQRTYIKMAVAGYKKKGTLSALTFMIRELTRFKTTVETDSTNKEITVSLEVDLQRQDFERVVDKVTFLVDEYAPPYKQLNLINTFLWTEDKRPFVFGDEDDTQLDLSLVDVTYETTEDWFNSNTSNTPAGESYYRDNFVSEVYFQDSVSHVETEPFTLAYGDTDDVDMAQNLTWSDTEDGTRTFTDILGIDPVTLNATTDYAYESAEWFGANVGLTNQTTTYLGETYITAVLEEFDEVITRV